MSTSPTTITGGETSSSVQMLSNTPTALESIHPIPRSSSLPTRGGNLREGSLHFVKADPSELVGIPAAANGQIKGAVGAGLENANALLNMFRLISFKESVADSLPPTVATPKVIFHFVRHAEATHNVKALGQDRWRTVDPDLTAAGLAQCADLKSNFERADKISLVLVSPMRRTLKTCVKAFPPVFQTHKPGQSHPVRVIAYPSLKEHGGGPAATGRPLDVLKGEMKETPVDWGLIYDGWEHEHTQTLEQRAAREERVKRELYELSQVVVKGGRWQIGPGLGLDFEAYKGVGNVEILVISHGAFLSGLLGHQKQIFRKADVKSFEFATMKHPAKEYSVATPYKTLRAYHTVKANELGVQANTSQIYSAGIGAPEAVSPASRYPRASVNEQVAEEPRWLSEWESPNRYLDRW